MFGHFLLRAASRGATALRPRKTALAGTLMGAVLIGCAEAPAQPASGDDEAFGVLSMPLATIVNGIRYRLTGDSFSIAGPISRDLQQNGSGTIVFATVPEGDYEVTLHDGWVLERQAESGFEPVQAELVSPNPRPVRIESEQTTLVAWVFETDGVPLSLDPPGVFQGNLAVVDSTNPASDIFGDVLATEPAHVEALAGIATIGGSLTVEGAIGSLAALTALTTVADELAIVGTGVTTLDALQSLTSVGGALTITGNSALPTCEATALATRLGTFARERVRLEAEARVPSGAHSPRTLIGGGGSPLPSRTV
jgi:hypothetical protein